MRAILSLVFFIFCALPLYSQTKVPVNPDTILPEKVVKSFQVKYPGKSDSVWVKDGDSYVITFTSDGKWYDVKFNKSGKWVESVVLITFEDLPEIVRANFEKSSYSNYEQLKIEQVENPQTALAYKFTLLSPKDDEIMVYFDSAGNEIPLK